MVEFPYNYERHTLQAVIAHDLADTVLKAYRHVTGAANICYLPASASGSKGSTFVG